MLKSTKALLSLVICLSFASMVQAISYVSTFQNNGSHTLKVRAIGGGNNTKLLVIPAGQSRDFINPNASCLHKYELYNGNANIAYDNNGIPQEGQWDNWYLANACYDNTYQIREVATPNGFKFELQ